MTSLGDYFGLHRLGEIAHPPHYSKLSAPSGSTSLPAAYHPTASGVVARFRFAGPGDPNDPLVVLAARLTAKGFCMHRPVPTSVAAYRADVEDLLRIRVIDREEQTYSFYDTGYGRPATHILRSQGIEPAYWQPSGETTGVIPDLEARDAALQAVVSQAEVKMCEKIGHGIFSAIYSQACNPRGLDLLFFKGMYEPFDLPLPTLDDKARTRGAKALGQCAFQMQSRGIEFEMLATWDHMLVLYDPGLTGHVYISCIIQREFSTPAGSTLADFLKTPLGCWTALACLDPPRSPVLRRRLQVMEGNVSEVIDELLLSVKHYVRQVPAFSSLHAAAWFNLGPLQVYLRTLPTMDIHAAARSLLNLNNVERPFFGPLQHRSQAGNSGRDGSDTPLLPCLDLSSDPETSLATSAPTEIQLNEMIGHGRLWDAFRAMVTRGQLSPSSPLPSQFSTQPGCDLDEMMNKDDHALIDRGSYFMAAPDLYATLPASPPWPVVVKMTCPRKHADMKHGVVDGLEDEAIDDTGFAGEKYVRRSVVKEILAYKILKIHQGKQFPWLYGVFGSTQLSETQEEVWIMVMQDCGTPIDLVTATPADRAKIQSRYTILHENGIIHGDAEPKHWLRDTLHNSIWIIDFEGAVFRSEVTCHEWAQLISAEMLAVNRWLQI